MRLVERARFDHWGIPTHEPKPGEKWFETSRVWVTNPRRHPAHLEYLRFAPDSPVIEFRRTNPHIAFQVPDLEQAVKGLKVFEGPKVVGDGLAKLAFADIDGVIVELIQWPQVDYDGWLFD